MRDFQLGVKELALNHNGPESDASLGCWVCPEMTHQRGHDLIVIDGVTMSGLVINIKVVLLGA